MYAMEEDMATRLDGSSLILTLEPEQDLIMFDDSSEESQNTIKYTVSLPGSMNGIGNSSHSASNHQSSPNMQNSTKDHDEFFPDLTMEKSATLSSHEPGQKPEIILYFLQASRAIRIAWLLEELNLEYSVVYYDREPSMAAPAEFKEASGGTMGKAPVLIDGNLVLEESGAITQ